MLRIRKNLVFGAEHLKLSPGATASNTGPIDQQPRAMLVMLSPCWLLLDRGRKRALLVVGKDEAHEHRRRLRQARASVSDSLTAT